MHPLKYGSFFDKKKELLDMIKAEEDFIFKSSGQHNRRIWIDLYETNLDDEIISAIILHIKAIQHKIFKLCFVGCSGTDKRKIKKQLNSSNIDAPFFSDPEKAKEWLIGERG